MSAELAPNAAHVSDAHAEAGVPWYVSGLRFECTGCGGCCTGGEGRVWVEVEEIRNLASSLSLPLDEFGRRYLRRIGRRYALLERVSNGDCVFLRDKRCTVYGVRPRQCRTFPFWPSHLQSPEAWEAAARDCEGIREEAPIVACAEIERVCPARKTDGSVEAASGEP